MLRPLSRDDLITILAESSGVPALVIVAPNYEPRSALGARELLRGIASRVSAQVWTLQAKGMRVEPLESLKEANRDEVLRLLKTQSIRVREHTVPYPEAFGAALISGFLDEAVKELGGDGVLVIDISTMPRRLVMRILRWWSDSDWRGRVVLLYAWASGYCRQPSEEGDLRLLETEESLAEALQDPKPAHITCFVVCGRQGFDTRQLLDMLPFPRHISARILLERFNLHPSLEVLRANVQVLTASRIDIQYCLSIDSGHQQIMQWANKVDLSPTNAYLGAPFGPKPFAVSAFLAVQQIEARFKAAGIATPKVLGTISLSGHQYNSPYSLGFRRWEAFELVHANDGPRHASNA